MTDPDYYSDSRSLRDLFYEIKSLVDEDAKKMAREMNLILKQLGIKSTLTYIKLDDSSPDELMMGVSIPVTELDQLRFLLTQDLLRLED